MICKQKHLLLWVLLKRAVQACTIKPCLKQPLLSYFAIHMHPLASFPSPKHSLTIFWNRLLEDYKKTHLMERYLIWQLITKTWHPLKKSMNRDATQIPKIKWRLHHFLEHLFRNKFIIYTISFMDNSAHLGLGFTSSRQPSQACGLWIEWILECWFIS